MSPSHIVEIVLVKHTIPAAKRTFLQLAGSRHVYFKLGESKNWFGTALRAFLLPLGTLAMTSIVATRGTEIKFSHAPLTLLKTEAEAAAAQA